MDLSVCSPRAEEVLKQPMRLDRSCFCETFLERLLFHRSTVAPKSSPQWPQSLNKMFFLKLSSSSVLHAGTNDR